MLTTQSPTEFTTFGELLRHLRRRAGMTQREFGQAVGYSEAHITRLEGGSRLPDVVAVKGAFVEALDLKREPEVAARLVALAQAAHGRVETIENSDGVSYSPIGIAANRQAPVGNLPTPATRLIGRKQDIAAVSQRLKEGEARLVTLVGPGGVGKTRLALEVARHIQGDFADGAWWVELAAMTEPQVALTTIAQALEIEDRPGKPILRVLQDHLRDKHLLLVLDNLEQVLDVAPLIGQVLGAALKVTVLATSRELLRISGEQSYIVNPLADEAVELFAQRAQAVKPDFALIEANKEVLAEICHKLDGLPLAIELAAARITLFTPQEILGMLGQRLSLLTGGARDLPARQRTLRATIDWSYQLLTPDEQALFRRLGVFAGGCTMHAAQAFCETDGLPLKAVEGLAALVAKNLLIREEFTIDPDAGNQNFFLSLTQSDEKHRLLTGSQKVGSYSRYHMLETVREYAREMLLERSEYDRWVRRLAEHLLTICTMANRPLPEERDNCLVTLQRLISTRDDTNLALKLATYGNIFTKNWDEHAEWLEQTLNGAGVSSDPEPRMFALAAHASSIGHQGDRAQSVSILLEVLAWYEAHQPMSDTTTGILYSLGHTYREMGRVEPSRQFFRKAMRVARERNFTEDIRHILITMSETEVAAENADEAERLLDEAMTFPLEENELMQAWSLNHRAHAAQLHCDLSKAEALLEQSLRLFSRIPYQREWGRAWDCQSLGEIALSRGQASMALKNFAQSLALFDRVGDKMGVSWCLCGFAGAYALNEEPEHGARLWGAGEALRKRIGCRIAPASRPNRERTEAMLREQLSAPEFARLAAEGAAWTLEQAVEEALKT